MKTLKCSCGKDISIDDWVYDKVKGLPFNCVRGAVYTSMHGVALSMASFVIDVPTGYRAEHKDRDIHNSLLDNLRVATKSQNGCNRGKQNNNTSGYKGVSATYFNTWQMGIKLGSFRVRLNFENTHEAALAYNLTAKRLHGEFACYNQVPIAEAIAMYKSGRVTQIQRSVNSKFV